METCSIEFGQRGKCGIEYGSSRTASSSRPNGRSRTEEIRSVYSSIKYGGGLPFCMRIKIRRKKVRGAENPRKLSIIRRDVERPSIGPYVKSIPILFDTFRLQNASLRRIEKNRRGIQSFSSQSPCPAETLHSFPIRSPIRP